MMAGSRGRRFCAVGSRNVLVRGWAAVVSVAVAAGLAACGGGASASADPSGALVVVVGAHSNMPPRALSGRSGSARETAVVQRSQFSLIVADGAPFQEGATVALTHEEGRQTVDEAVAGARARSPEADLVGALRLAAQELDRHGGLRTLVVVDSGLSTTGIVNFSTPGMLDAHPGELADALNDAQQLPDLSGIAVVFDGLGETASPQQALDPIRQAQLAAIWTAIAQRAGATSVHVDETTASATAAPDASLPPVTPIEPGLGYSCEGTTMTLVGGPFAFRPDSDQFVDAPAAVQVLTPIATQLRAKGISATMFGTTAAVGEVADRVRFSDERAQAVADMLIDLDVPIPQLHVEGLGSDFPDYGADRDGAGRLLPAAAALNRTVRIEFSGPVTCG